MLPAFLVGCGGPGRVGPQAWTPAEAFYVASDGAQRRVSAGVGMWKLL